MRLGEVNELQVLRFTSSGAFLGDEEGNDVLLPGKYITDEMELDEPFEVYLYKDSEDRLVATTERPLVQLNGFAYLEIKEVGIFGAFADWGLEKDLLIPFKEQHQKLEKGQIALVTLQIDEATNRLFGSTKVRRYFEKCEIPLEDTRPVDILICDKTDLGVNVIVEDRFSGLIYNNDLSRYTRKGEKSVGYVYNVRPDGKLDIRLEPPGRTKISEASQKLLDILQTEKVLHIHDKSAPEDIRSAVGMSKKTFKQAVGDLYKRRLIELGDEQIRLV